MTNKTWKLTGLESLENKRLLSVTVKDPKSIDQWANLYRPALISVVGSSRHGFNIQLNKNWFYKGTNNIMIQVYDPISKQVSIVWERTINKK